MKIKDAEAQLEVSMKELASALIEWRDAGGDVTRIVNQVHNIAQCVTAATVSRLIGGISQNLERQVSEEPKENLNVRT